MLKGSIVALITPFKNNILNEDKYRQLIHYHLENGTNGIVPGGTTGESQLYLIMNIEKLSIFLLKNAMEKFL